MVSSMLSHHRPIECVAWLGKSQGKRFKEAMNGMEWVCVCVLLKNSIQIRISSKFRLSAFVCISFAQCTSPISSPMKCEMNRNNFYLNVK